MRIMAERKKKPESAPEPEEIKPIYVRPDTPALAAVIDRIARSERRSRNTMILILLEEALKARDAWPA